MRENESHCKVSVKKMISFLKQEGIVPEVHGNLDLFVRNLCNVEKACPGSMTFYIGNENSSVQHLKNCVLVCFPEIKTADSVTRITCSDPKLAFYILAQLFNKPSIPKGIHPTALVHPEAKIHASASIGPYSVLEKCVIGKDVVIHSHVQVYEKTIISDRSTIESGTCIGATGQIWAWGRNNKRWVMPQLGGVKIEEDCFIGSNISIVRGALQDTIIRKGARISHGSMIGHNCYIGKETFLSNRIAMAGSVTVGNYCFLGSGSVLQPGIEIGNHVTVGAGAVVTKSFKKEGLILTGVPAKILKKISKGDSVKGVPTLSRTSS